MSINQLAPAAQLGNYYMSRATKYYGAALKLRAEGQEDASKQMMKISSRFKAKAKFVLS